VNPKATVALDVLALATLVLGRKDLPSSRGISGVQRWLSILAGVAFMVAAAALMVHRDSVGDRGGLVVLRPGDWIGKSFPLEKYLSDEGSLRQGKWLVFLYRHDCPVCERAMPAYMQLGRQLSAELGKPARIAFVEVPTAAASDVGKGETCCYWFKLSETRTWTGATPMVLMLRDGQVAQAKQGEDASTPPASAEQWLKGSD
jgi:hypothetical protein